MPAWYALEGLLLFDALHLMPLALGKQPLLNLEKTFSKN